MEIHVLALKHSNLPLYCFRVLYWLTIGCWPKHLFPFLFPLLSEKNLKSRNITKTTCFILFILYPEFYQDTNEEYGVGIYTLRCELADGKGYYLCAEITKYFLWWVSSLKVNNLFLVSKELNQNSLCAHISMRCGT